MPMTPLTWKKSSYSFANGNCLEVTELPGGDIGVRDSKDPEGPVLRFTDEEWRWFIRDIRNGRIGIPEPVAGALIEPPRPRGIALSRFIVE
jgi:hypothetical protein